MFLTPDPLDCFTFLWFLHVISEKQHWHCPNVLTKHEFIYVRLAQLFKGDEFPVLKQEKEERKRQEIENIFVFIKIYCCKFLSPFSTTVHYF